LSFRGTTKRFQAVKAEDAVKAENFIERGTHPDPKGLQPDICHEQAPARSMA
jgi:hypothetical protein